MGTTERRERERRERRAEILRAAREVFWRRGYEGTTMPEIAKAAELAPGTLYLYFPGKEALYAELLDEGYAILISRMRKGIPGSASPRDQAGALIDIFLGFARDNPEYFDIIFFVLQREGRKILELPPERGSGVRIEARQEECRRFAWEVLRRAFPGMSEEGLGAKVESVWSMLAGVVLYFVREDRKLFAAVAGEAKRIILQGLFGAGGGTAAAGSRSVGGKGQRR